MHNAAVDRQQLSVESAVTALCRTQFLGKEAQRLPTAARHPLLQHCANVRAIGVGD
jgi:hypothetical protein